jgi:hypothetical protein
LSQLHVTEGITNDLPTECEFQSAGNECISDHVYYFTLARELHTDYRRNVKILEGFLKF